MATLVGRPLSLNEPRCGKAILLILGALAFKLLLLAALQRPWGCGCGLIWSLPDPRLNSRVLLDPYTLLHLAFGALLIQLLMKLRPDWSAWTLFAAVVASSTIWEVAENLPLSIRLFGYSPGDVLAYHGDSRLNSLADTAAALLGAALAIRLPLWTALAAIGGIELGLSLWIGDGYVIALARALAPLFS